MSALAERFRALGDKGLFAKLAAPASLSQGCRELELLAYEAPELGVFISIIAHAGLALPILSHSSQARLLKDALAGSAILAVAITERGAGSDVHAMQTKLARGPAGKLVLSGSKWHITNAPVADAIIVFAVDTTTDDRFLTAVLVKREDRGVVCGPALDLIGCKGSPTGELVFDSVVVGEERIISRREDGRRLLELAFVRERALAPWPLLGKMARVIEECLDYVETREQFGKPIHEFQYVQEKIVSSFEQMIHARLLAERALTSSALSSLAKAVAADAAAHVFRAAIEVHGSYGVQTERHYGEYLHDAMCAQIAGGTRETHKKVVFGELRLERARAKRGRPSPLIRGGNIDG